VFDLIQTERILMMST